MKRNRFTLVEVLMVIGLIGVLTALAIGGYSYAMESSKISATRAIIKQVEAALENAQVKHGFYPTDAEGKIYILDSGSADAEEVAKKWGGAEKKDFLTPFMTDFLKTLDVEAMRQYVDDDGALCDAWGEPLIYKAPDTDLKKSFSIRSKGPDGETGTEEKKADDLTN